MEQDFGKKIIYLWLCWVFLLREGFLDLQRAGATLELWCMGGGFSRCQGARASVVAVEGLQRKDSVVVARGLSCSEACGVFLGQGSNGLLSTEPPANSFLSFFFFFFLIKV